MNLDSLRGWFRGEHCVVVAPGPSALRMSPSFYEGHWTIGCNRAVAFCRPDFAVCFEPRKDSCWRVIRAATPFAVFTHAQGVYDRAIVVSTDVSEWLLGTGGPLTLSMSPFWGAAVAVAMGFARIALIGVDLDGDGGRFSDSRFQKEWEAAWGRLVQTARRYSADLVNLNDKSLLKAVPKVKAKTVHGKL